MLKMLLSCPSTWLHSLLTDFTTAEKGAAVFSFLFLCFSCVFSFFVLDFSGRGISLITLPEAASFKDGVYVKCVRGVRGSH
jgi:hypothetical protein